MAEINLALILKAQDYASRVFNQMRGNVNKSTKDIENQAVQSGAKQQEAVRRTARVTEQSFRTMQQAARTVTRDRESLGIRSENAIQREIAQTMAAYQRLKASGSASSRELARAAEATRAKIAGLNAEMGKTTWGQRLGNIGRNVASATVGVTAGAMVAAPKIKNAADYDLEIAKISNTAYSGLSIEEKSKGKEKIHNSIKEALSYGGTKEDALGAIGRLTGEGNVSVDDALKLLPTIQKNATATGASTDDIAALVNSLLNFGIKVDDIQKALDYANASGKAGGFELKDMARYAPEFLSSAGNAGLSGLEDLKQVLKGAQQVYKVSGGTGQTSTNLVNYFSKLRSSDTAKKFEKLEVYDPKTKKTHGIDFEKSMTNEMKTGKNPLEAFMSIIDQILASDQTYQKLLKQLDKAKDDKEAQAAAERIAKYVETTRLAEVMPDIQAGTAMFAMRRDKNTAQNVDEQYAIADKGNFNQADFDFMRQQNAVRFQIAKNKQEMASIENWNGANNKLGEAADWAGENMDEFPNLTKAVVGATDALQIFGAGLTGFSLVDLLTGGKMKSMGGFGATTTTATTTTTAATGTTGASAGVLGSAVRLASVFGLTLTLSGDTQKDPEKEKQIADRNSRAKTLLEKVRDGSASDEERAEFKGMNSARYVDDELNSAFNDFSFYSLFTSKKQKNASLDYLKSRLEKGDVTDADSQAIQSLLDKREATSSAQAAENARLAEKYPKQYQQLTAARTTDYSGLANAANDTDSALSRTLGSLSGLANYQADFQHFGQTISDGLKAAIESQNITIQNQIKVDLDGRIVAEQTSEHQYQDMKRWG